MENHCWFCVCSLHLFSKQIASGISAVSCNLPLKGFLLDQALQVSQTLSRTAVFGRRQCKKEYALTCGPSIEKKQFP